MFGDTQLRDGSEIPILGFGSVQPPVVDTLAKLMI